MMMTPIDVALARATRAGNQITEGESGSGTQQAILRAYPKRVRQRHDGVVGRDLQDRNEHFTAISGSSAALRPRQTVAGRFDSWRTLGVSRDYIHQTGTAFMNVLIHADPIATTEQFKAALLATRDWNGIAPIQLQMLQAQCRAPDCTISAFQMAGQLSFKNVAAARLQYGAFARSVADKLGYAPPQKGKGTPCWWFTLSTGRDVVDDAGDGHFEWIMRPELVAALRAMKWA